MTVPCPQRDSCRSHELPVGQVRCHPVTIIETTLVHPDPAKPRFFHLKLDGRQLTSRTWAGTNAGRRTAKDLGDIDDRGAKQAFEKARNRKMREGFCHRADVDSAVRGDIVLEFLGVDNYSGNAFDLSPDDRRLAFGRMRDNAYGYEIFVMDLATGHRRLVREVTHQPHQTFLFTVFFHPDGRRIIYVINGQTILLDPDTGQEEILAEYNALVSPNFNQHMLKQVRSRDRRRLVLFDTGNRIKVVDTELATVSEMVAPKSDFECQSAALSPTGELLALSLSKGKDHDETNPVVTTLEIWDVGTGRLRQRITAENRVSRLGFDPTGQLLISSGYHSSGLDAFDIETGSPVWHFPDPQPAGEPAYCFDWDYTPGCTELAIGGWGSSQIFEAETWKQDPAFGYAWPLPGEQNRIHGVQFSSDGRLLVTGGQAGRVVIYRM